MPELPEHEERHVREYVDSQWGEDDLAEIVQKVGSQRVLGQVYEIYDVQCEKTRWWVISDPMNLYDQDDFPEADTALTFHIGLRIRMAQHSRTAIEEEKEEHVSGAWRRFEQAVEAMNSATEAEDFQAVGIKCREALLALARDHADAEWLQDVDPRPKVADFKGWGSILAEKLAQGRMRAYTKDLVDGTWDLTVWLEHYSEATPSDAEVVVDATSHLLGLFGMLLHRREKGPPARCPRCGSYALDEDTEVVEEPEPGYLASTVCRACDWRSDRTFTAWEKHFEGADIEGYLNRPHTGLSDRLNRRRPRARSEDPADAALVGVPWQFRFVLRPVAGSATPTQPPVEIRAEGANVWVHTVRLSWMPSQPGGSWTVEDAECPPWRADDSLPMQLFSTGRALELKWPEANPDQQVQLHTRLRVEWSATEKGPRHWREADGGSTSWQ